VQRYDRKPKAGGRWVTIGAKLGEDGKKHGGSPVFIEGGRITRGHPSLTGRRIDALHEEPVEVPGRRLQDWAKANERAKHLSQQALQANLAQRIVRESAGEPLAPFSLSGARL
jgi:hypothetical protein